MCHRPKTCSLQSSNFETNIVVRRQRRTIMAFPRLAPRVRRAFLYLQGYDGKKITKAVTHRPTLDCVCLDMEDGVGSSKKDQARAGIVHALRTVDFGTTEPVVRINSLDTGDLAMRDLEAVLTCPTLPKAICIPKVESAADVRLVSERLDALGDVAHDVRIISMIESPMALLHMEEICTTASPHRMDCVVFGADDYASAVGATRTQLGQEMDFARNLCLLQAAAYGVDAIDMVQIDFTNIQQLQTESRSSFELGYTGKQVIHPNQIDPAQQAYSPTNQAIEDAALIVRANREHQEHGEGAFSFHGKMIDMPTVKQFENLLQRAALMGLYHP
jgi:citrate lyase subunit beta-like protein